MKRQNTLLYALISVAAIVAVVGLVVLMTRSGGGNSPAGNSSETYEAESAISSVTESEISSSQVSEMIDSTISSEPTVPVDVTPESKVSITSSENASSEIGSQISGYTRQELAAELDDWNLFLVNPDNTIDENWTPQELKSVGNDQSIDSRIYSAYNAMISAAKKDGVSLWVVSGYRSYSKQNRLYNNRVTRSKNENPSFTQEEAEADAARNVARPGTSEHQLGLAIDFNSVETSFADTKAGKWLKEHAAEYGFILRYEEDKQDITKVTYEPWHYRYVGAKHALTMQEKGMCMEEYIDWLQNS